MSIMIFNHGAGGGSDLAVKVIGGTVQPTGAAGILWCNTNAQPGKWTFSVAAPSSPATGDLWMQTDAVSTRMINLLKRNGAIVNLVRVWQWNGTSWVRIYAYYHNGYSWTQVSTTFDPASDISFAGTKTLIDEGNGHWRMELTSSEKLRFLAVPDTTIDVFLVGGGSGGWGGGGGGGCTKTVLGKSVQIETDYPIVIGAGGARGAAGGTSSGLGESAAGGTIRTSGEGAYGGSGGSGGGGGSWYNAAGAGGSNGENGGKAASPDGIGQGTTTKAFGESTGALYGGGGGGGSEVTPGLGGAGGGGAGSKKNVQAAHGVNNSGGGGGGTPGTGAPGTYAGLGGSGIVIIRDHR